MAEVLRRELHVASIEIVREGDELRIRARPGAVDPFRARIVAHKAALLALLRGPDDPLLMPDRKILESEAARRPRAEIESRIVRLEARAVSPDGTDQDAEIVRIWRAILVAKDRPVSPPAPAPVLASALPDPWNPSEGRAMTPIDAGAHR